MVAFGFPQRLPRGAQTDPMRTAAYVKNVAGVRSEDAASAIAGYRALGSSVTNLGGGYAELPELTLVPEALLMMLARAGGINPRACCEQPAPSSREAAAACLASGRPEPSGTWGTAKITAWGGSLFRADYHSLSICYPNPFTGFRLSHTLRFGGCS